MRNRAWLEQHEISALAPFACKSNVAQKTRLYPEAEHPYRTAFQRDRDRIIHSRAFRRLKHKRQVFLPAAGDHYRTRLTHTLEVAQLSRTMARAIGLNEDLVEAIALGHDIGHTPFGHLGEVVLHQIMTGNLLFQAQKQPFTAGGFKHNYQSVRIVDKLEKKYLFDGLNLTAPVREGLLKHTRLRRGKIELPDFRYEGLQFESDVSSTLEGQVVAISDEIAQRTHDLEDGIRAGLVELDKVKKLEIIRFAAPEMEAIMNGSEKDKVAGLLIRGLINFLVDDVLKESCDNIEKFAGDKISKTVFDQTLINFSEKVNKFQLELNQFIYQEIISYSRITWSDQLGEKLLFRLFESFYLYPQFLPKRIYDGLFAHNPELAKILQKQDAEIQMFADEEAQLNRVRNDNFFLREICDYIAGMTDHFAVREALRLAEHNILKVNDLKLDIALGNSA